MIISRRGTRHLIQKIVNIAILLKYVCVKGKIGDLLVVVTGDYAVDRAEVRGLGLVHAWSEYSRVRWHGGISIRVFLIVQYCS